MIFSDKLTDLRFELGASQRNLAHSIGLSKSAYNRLETGSTDPTLSTLILIANFFELSLPDLLTDIGPP